MPEPTPDIAASGIYTGILTLDSATEVAIVRAVVARSGSINASAGGDCEFDGQLTVLHT